MRGETRIRRLRQNIQLLRQSAKLPDHSLQLHFHGGPNVGTLDGEGDIGQNEAILRAAVKVSPLKW